MGNYCERSGMLISIHALLAESDHGTCIVSLSFADISIHALLAESDLSISKTVRRHLAFLSTLSLRRATTSRLLELMEQAKFLSTLSLRRATCQVHSNTRDQAKSISIHALLAESDAIRIGGLQYRLYNFYPRSPCGERLLMLLHDTQLRSFISIHALLAESDSKSAQNSGALLRI